MSKMRDFVDELRDNEARYRHVFSAAYEGIWFVDDEGRTTYVNERMADMLGYSRDEMVGRFFYEFAHDEDRPSLELHLRQRRRNIAAQYDFRYRRKDGSDLWALICARPIVDEAGEFHGVLGMHTDITERKKIEERLLQLAAMVEGAGDAMLSMTLDGTVVTWNRAAERTFGYRAEEMVGGSVFRLVPDDTRDEHLELMSRVLAGETVQGFESVCMRMDGKRIECAITMAPVQDAGGTIARIAASCRDVTERRREQDALRHAQKMEAVNRLAGGVAHDFNNMLAVILGQLALLARQPDLPASTEGPLRSIKAAAEQSQSIVRQLLALGQRQGASPRAVDLNALLASMRDMLEHSVGEGVTFELVLGPAVGSVWVDPALMQQVILNLVLNARDAMPEGGRLRVATRETDIGAAEARLRGLRAGRTVVLSVDDSGSGIEPEALRYIFEPFFTTKPFGKGSGLGLAMTEGIVRKAGGQVDVRSEVGQGSTFEVRLPVHGEAPVERRARSGTETILLVDDEALVRSTTRQMLSTCGYHVIEAGLPDEALTMAKAFEGTIHLVLTDVRMPGMRGPEMVARLLEMRPDVRVVYMSAWHADDDVAASVDAGRAGYVPKPFSVEAVAWKVREVLDAGFNDISVDR